MRVVLDTNIVVSAFLAPAGAPAQIFQSWRRQAFEMAVSEPLLSEYQRALLYERVATRHGMATRDVVNVIGGIRHVALLVIPQETITAIHEDPDDNVVLECAVAGGADYVVTGDVHLLKLRQFRGIEILSPASFLTILKQEKGG